MPAAYVDECFIPADLTDKGKSLDRYGLHWWILNYNGIDVRYARGILVSTSSCCPKKTSLLFARAKRENK